MNGLKFVAEEEEEETAPEKRLRLAKEYIAQVEEEGKFLLYLFCQLYMIVIFQEFDIFHAYNNY